MSHHQIKLITEALDLIDDLLPVDDRDSRHRLLRETVYALQKTISNEEVKEK